MRLRKFRVRAYRCIHDSGEITVGDLAAFVGRNESGKTTILQALTLLNRDEEVSELDLCDEMSEDLKNEIKLAEGEFELNQHEIKMLKEKFPSLPEIKKLDYLEQIESPKFNTSLMILSLEKKKIKDSIHGKTSQNRLSNF
ncbi:AAA family ATPase [Nitrosopumilus sp. SJ]|uniref:AAA family ATPase n=1 Tax=Nitrosopumilus sp. SJ TaxID=1027374 RepID=UPI0009FC75BA|nr:AAA family ATPase [Nitrosopumilus sp. SJ]